MRRFTLLAYLLIVSACVSAEHDAAPILQIKTCIEELANEHSSNVANGWLEDRWSVAHVRTYSESGLTFISFKTSLSASDPTFESLNHRWAILCNVDEDGGVVYLASPDVSGTREDLVEYVANEPVEDEAYERIADYLRSGKAVYSFESYFRITDGDISQVGETEKSRVDPTDFGVN